MIRVVTAVLLAVLSAAALAQAPAGPPVRIRGVVEKLDGQNMTVKARDGQSMSVKLAENYTVMGIAKASLADIGSGKFIGTTTVGERDGALVAEEVHIFAESLRGLRGRALRLGPQAQQHDDQCERGHHSQCRQ